jgi:hypothetical protein
MAHLNRWSGIMIGRAGGLLWGIGLVAALATPAAAQRGGFLTARPAMPLRASVAAVPRAMGPVRVITVQATQSSPTRMVRTSVAPAAAISTAAGLSTTPILTPTISAFAPLTVSQLLNSVPGFGFDFRHLAAVNQNLDIRAFIDPVTQQRLALAERLLRETPVFPAVFPAFGASPVVLVESPPPVVLVQQPEAAPVAAAPPARPPVVAAAIAIPPLPVGDLILVRKDGSRILATAFTQQGNQIVYITRDGRRRSIALADLDLDATVRVNEANGTLLRFSH